MPGKYTEGDDRACSKPTNDQYSWTQLPKDVYTFTAGCATAWTYVQPSEAKRNQAQQTTKGNLRQGAR